MSNGHRGRGNRMTKAWSAISSGVFGFTVNATALMGSRAFAEARTVLRLLGEYVAVPSAAPAANDQAIITVGIGVVSTDAATLGSTAMPDPFDEPEYPWLYWASHDFLFEDTSLDVGGHSTGLRRSFDVGSMRKIKPRESLVFVAQYTDVAGGPPMIFSASSTRVLLAT